MLVFNLTLTFVLSLSSKVTWQKWHGDHVLHMSPGHTQKHANIFLIFHFNSSFHFLFFPTSLLPPYVTNPKWAIHGNSLNEEENWLLRFMRLWWFIHLSRKEAIYHVLKAVFIWQSCFLEERLSNQLKDEADLLWAEILSKNILEASAFTCHWGPFPR
jgi:hypothetical protein